MVFFRVISILVLILTDIYVPIYIKRYKYSRFSNQKIQADEVIQSIAKTHWIVMVKMITIQLILSILCLMFFIMGDFGISGQGWIPAIITMGLICWFLAILRKQVLYWCQEFVLTNKRVLYRVTSIHELPIEKVELCAIAHGHVGKLLGYSSIIIYGIGGNCHEGRFVNTRNAIMFQQDLMETLSSENKLQSDSLSQKPGPQYKDSIDELQAFKKLLDDGVITKEEFEKKKGEILAR